MVFGPIFIESPFFDHCLFEFAALSHSQSPFLFLFGFYLTHGLLCA